MATCAFAHKGDAVAIELDTDLDISRGAVLSDVQRRPINADVLEARLVWLAEAPFDPEAGYLLRTATDLTPVTSISVSALVDFETLASTPAHACAANDIADCRILLGRPTPLDLFADLPATGNFILVSAVDGTTVAGGVIGWAQAGAATVGDNVFVLDRELLAKGLCSDLGDRQPTSPNSIGAGKKPPFCCVPPGFPSSSKSEDGKIPRTRQGGDNPG